MFHRVLLFTSNIDICDKRNDVIGAPLGIVTSPNYPAEYPANENCEITLDGGKESTNGYMLKFESFHMGTRRFVKLYNPVKVIAIPEITFTYTNSGFRLPFLKRALYLVYP